MPRPSAHRLLQPLRAAPRELAALLLCAAVAATIAARATAAASAGGKVDAYSFPTFDAHTTDALTVATNTSLLVPASLLFRPERLYPELSRSEGFLLLSRTVDVWLAGTGAGGGAPSLGREASFNTSFTLRGASPVAFAVLLDRFPLLNAAIGLHGDANGSAAAPNASSSLAAVEVGTVRSYGPEEPNVGLNVTVTPAGAAPSRAVAVWIEYAAAGAHRLRRRCRRGQASRGPPRRAAQPRRQKHTQTAFVGFFAAAVSVIFVGVQDIA